MNKPKTWHDVYPHGTKQGDEEAKFFRALARDTKYTYKSVAQIMKETGLSRERVEEIIEKYHSHISPPLVYQHSTSAENWAYWERVPDSLKVDDRNISQKDQDNRIDGHIRGSSCCTGGCNGTCKEES